MSELIDPKMLEQLLQLEADEASRRALFTLLFDVFRTDNLEKAELLLDAANSGNRAEVGRIAHTMKGAALSMGAVWLAELAEKCEHLADEKAGDITPKCLEIKEKLEETLLALENRFAG